MRGASAQRHGQFFDDSAAVSIVLPRPRAIRAVPFLAQFIAQEIIGPSEPTPRWRERDSAYRTAAAGDAAAGLSIEA